MDRFEQIVTDPAICGGEAVMKGTRVTLRTVLGSLAEGASVEEILADFPTLTHEHVLAAITFAAFMVTNDMPSPRLPEVA